MIASLEWLTLVIKECDDVGKLIDGQRSEQPLCLTVAILHNDNVGSRGKVFERRLFGQSVKMSLDVDFRGASHR